MSDLAQPIGSALYKPTTIEHTGDAPMIQLHNGSKVLEQVIHSVRGYSPEILGGTVIAEDPGDIRGVVCWTVSEKTGSLKYSAAHGAYGFNAATKAFVSRTGRQPQSMNSWPPELIIR